MLQVKAPAKELVRRDSGDRNSEIGVADQKMRKIPMRSTREGGHAVTIGDIPSLEWFQAIPNGKCRFIILGWYEVPH